MTTAQAPCYWSSPVLCLLYGNCWPSTFWQLSQIISRKFSHFHFPHYSRFNILRSAITWSTFPRPENVALFIFAKSKFSSRIGRERESLGGPSSIRKVSTFRWKCQSTQNLSAFLLKRFSTLQVSIPSSKRMFLRKSFSKQSSTITRGGAILKKRCVCMIII